jgi:hypothetical protein
MLDLGLDQHMQGVEEQRNIMPAILHNLSILSLPGDLSLVRDRLEQLHVTFWTLDLVLI